MKLKNIAFLSRRRRQVSGLIFTGLLLGAAFGADPRFGVMTHFAQGWDPSLAPVISAGGVLRIRDEVYWEAVEAQKGVFKFPATFDSYMNALAQENISPLVVLSFENHNYDGGQTPYTTEGFNAYARYAVQVLRRYGSRVKAVEIWNEYNGTFNRGPASEDRANTYMKMLKVAYTAIKAERPDVTVLAGGTAGIPYPYWEKLLEGGVLNYSDALSIHPYRFNSRPEGIETDIAYFRTLVQRYGTPKPIWVSEIGWELKTSKANGDFAITEDVQAKFLVRGHVLLLSAGIENIYWYFFKDDASFSMGLIKDDAARTRKPAYRAMANLSKFLDGATFVKRESTPDELYSMLFRTASGVEKRVIWSRNALQFPVRGATAATDIFGKSVSVAGSITANYMPLFVTGPVSSLPAAPNLPAVIADSVSDFRLGTNPAWSYGFFTSGTVSFRKLPTLQSTDWETQWTGEYPYLSVSATTQHPSVAGPLPISAVRRWTSPIAGKVRIKGNFTCGTEGDGVGVRVVVNGTQRFRKLLGTASPTGVVYDFDLTETMQIGSTVDFAVDPGPNADINYDSTSVSVIIRPQP